MVDKFLKDPDAVLDYKFDWSEWLADGETITESTVTAETGITVDSSALSDINTSVTVWLSGGTAGSRCTVTNHIVTAAGREDDRSILFYIQER